MVPGDWLVHRNLVRRDFLPREQVVRPVGQHALRVVRHERCSLDMEVSKHFIRSPSADEADDVGVDLREEQRVCPAGSQGARGDVLWQEAERRSNVGHGRPQRVGDAFGRDSGTPGDTGEGRAWWEVVLPSVQHPPNHRLHRAEVGVPTQPETDNFPSHSILLSRKGERDKGSTTNFAVSRRGEVDLRLTDEELIVFDLKLKLVVRVIPRAAEEEEAYRSHVRRRLD